MARAIGRVALGGVCAGLALYVAVQSDNEMVQATAALTGSCFLGFTVTSLVIERHREQKNRESHADMYLELLRQMNAQRPPEPQQPVACQGCRHYHGRVYNGNLFICAMYPYGVETERCPDWEARLAAEIREWPSYSADDLEEQDTL